MASRLLVLLCFSLLAAGPVAAAEPPLVADMSQDSISITSSFTGTEILLFGAIDRPGDVVVVVQGPREDLVVRRKARVSGIWMNRKSVTFHGVPAYYAVASSRPLEDIAPPTVRARYRLGGDYLDFAIAGETHQLAGQELLDFREAILRNKAREDLFVIDEEQVRFRDHLFRTSLVFPANAPEGDYSVNVYLMRGGRVVDNQQSTLSIRKAGLERTIFDLANEQPALYGLIAIVIALFAGWLAAVAFRRT
jgi:uncharacterized protein (TIGR02186 family)